MTSEEIDSVLSGVIILLIIVVIWKWRQGYGKCGQSSMTLSCGCQYGKCKCKGVSRVSVRRARCQGGRSCPCGCPPGRCNCGTRCGCHRRASIKEGMRQGCDMPCYKPQVGTPGYEPKVVHDDGNYSGDTVQKMALEPQVIQSQKDYIDGLGFSGLPTGSSHETVLEETGRSYGTANFHGLTQRKWCKARQLATPSSDSRVVPTETIREWCSVDLDELV